MSIVLNSFAKSRCKVCYGKGVIKKFNDTSDKKGQMILCHCINKDKMNKAIKDNEQNNIATV